MVFRGYFPIDSLYTTIGGDTLTWIFCSSSILKTVISSAILPFQQEEPPAWFVVTCRDASAFQDLKASMNFGRSFMFFGSTATVQQGQSSARLLRTVKPCLLKG